MLLCPGNIKAIHAYSYRMDLSQLSYMDYIPNCEKAKILFTVVDSVWWPLLSVKFVKFVVFSGETQLKKS